ncbi:DUF6296 family protein [Streptomyces rubellomurinus]|uniref:Uncharacterized protein n=1 Tax=Streptomyces rubellomurinus (strain ATCC 31215) TaxID=359131 RepID=A0A0F2TDY3_STRR3|nr:DUF6296 family protein [Streptomyces rubellomurinus]KJS61428.1 hypothetical protein VM95_14790 [Streptomyces rubellomurinus]
MKGDKTDVQGRPASLAATAKAVTGYLLWMRDDAGRSRTVPVAVTGRLGPAGHPVYADQDGTVQVEITDDGRHRALTVSPSPIIVAKPLV